MDRSPPAAQPRLATPASPIPEVSIIVPARNEEANLGACLESLTAQTGVAFEIIVVDDASTDRTREIAQSFAGVQVISAGSLSKDRAGKRLDREKQCAHCRVRNKRARPGCSSPTPTRCIGRDRWRERLTEAKERASRFAFVLARASSRHLRRTRCDARSLRRTRRAISAAESARSQRTQESVAANGQYILVRRAAYDAVGGHAAVATEILEDVALARRFRDAGQTRLLSLWRRRRPHPHVPQLAATSRGLDQKSGAAISAARISSVPEFALVVRSVVGAGHRRIRRRQTRHFLWIAFDLFLAVAVPANSRRPFRNSE